MLTATTLVVRNLAYHWRSNAAVLLGVTVGAAVLTGALLVGDSLRGSLRQRVEGQLHDIDAVAFLPRPIRLERTDDKRQLTDGLPGFVAPVLMLPGSLQAAGDPATAPYLGRITVWGVDDRFSPTSLATAATIDWNGTPRHIVLSQRVAEKLGVSPGATVRLGVERFSDVPRSSSLAKRSIDDVTSTEEFEVVAILPHAAPENDLNLTPNPAAPLNVFVPLRALARLTTGQAAPTATLLLARGASAAELDQALRARLQIEDYGLKMREIDFNRRSQSGGYVSVEATELILPPRVVSAIESAARRQQWRAEPTVIYVADTLSHGAREIPYPVIAGLNPTADPPLGPFLPPDVDSLGDDDIVLLEWEGSELNGLPAGTKIRLRYFDPEVEGAGVVREAEFTLRGYLRFPGPAQDRHLVPEIAGVTDARADLYNWDRPPVLPKETIRQRVPDKHPRSQFFNVHKATPMAYLSLAAARRLFSSRYGSDTSVRIAPPEGKTLEQTTDEFRDILVQHLDPAANGFAFDPIRDRLLTASRGGNDFGLLFLGFSCFLIIAALMLVGLLFRLSLDRRAKEMGLLLATGYTVSRVRRLLLAEGLLVAVAGAALGLAVAIAYNQLLLAVLIELWPDAEVRSYLQPHFTVWSFALGFVATIVMAAIALSFSIRGLVKVPPPALLRGETNVVTDGLRGPRRGVKALAVIGVVTGVGLIASGGRIDNPDIQALTFFSGGGLLLIAALAALWLWMNRTRHRVVNGRGLSAVATLGYRNAARNPGRSLLTALMLAAAAFLLVAVESFRRQPDREFLSKTGGSGGFNLVAECDVPVFQSFDAGPGRADLERQLQRAFAPPEADPDAPPETPEFRAAQQQLAAIEEVLPLRVRAGDDASCANLFQATRPRVLGIPDAFLGGEKRFKFTASVATTDEEKANPWRLLLTYDQPNEIPVVCEQNTAQWMLKKAVGDTFIMPGDDGRDLTFRIVATLVDSPFQSELITSDSHFARAFPQHTGYRAFLIRTAAGTEDAVARLLQIGLRVNGLTASSTRERVATYQAVIGAYLSTFQLLGGLGLLLGVLGLAVVILRGVWERLGELALLRAVGYRPRTIQFLVLVENVFLLVLGLLAGVAAALVSVAPHVAGGATVPWANLAVMLGLVLMVGFAVMVVATAGILRVPVIPALRRE